MVMIFSGKLKTRKSIIIFYNNWYNDLKNLKELCENNILNVEVNKPRSYVDRIWS